MASKKKTTRKTYTRVKSPGTTRLMIRVRNSTLEAVTLDAEVQSRSMAAQAGRILDEHYAKLLDEHYPAKDTKARSK